MKTITALLLLAAPSLPYVTPGATVGECARYGRWWASQPMSALSEPRAGAPVAFRIAARERLEGLTGFVETYRFGSVQAPRGLDLKGKRVSRGQRVEVLYDIGEAVYAGLLDGAPVDVVPEEFGESYPIKRPPTYEWWAFVRNARGRTGWLPMGKVPLIYGVDGCGGLPDWAK